jgi:hypothetical protein
MEIFNVGNNVMIIIRRMEMVALQFVKLRNSMFVISIVTLTVLRSAIIIIRLICAYNQSLNLLMIIKLTYQLGLKLLAAI